MGFSILDSAARIASTPSADGSTFVGKSNNTQHMMVLINVTAIDATPSVTPKLQIQEPAAGVWIDYWAATTPLTATGTHIYIFSLYAQGDYPSVSANVRERVHKALPDGGSWRIYMDHADADSITYSVGGHWCSTPM